MAVGADAGDRANVDKRDMVFAEQHVVRLQIVIDNAARVQVIQRG